ncbi:MAG: thioredoxin family protein [Phyllobacterium sp.]
MPKTEANPIALGTRAADFILPDADGKLYELRSFVEKPALLVAFLSNRCPFVVLLRGALAEFALDYAPKGLQIVAINSNDASAYPEESLARIGEERTDAGYSFPYLKDEAQTVARAYGAACTPDLFLFDAERRLVYHGQFDDARPGNGKPVTGADLKAAVDALLAGGKPSPTQIPSIGCNIKWIEGRAPSSLSHAA